MTTVGQLEFGGAPEPTPQAIPVDQNFFSAGWHHSVYANHKHHPAI